MAKKKFVVILERTAYAEVYLDEAEVGLELDFSKAARLAAQRVGDDKIYERGYWKVTRVVEVKPQDGG